MEKTIKDIIEDSKKGKTNKIYGLIYEKGLIREYECLIVPIKHILGHLFPSVISKNYKIILTDTSNDYTKVIETWFSDVELNENRFSSDDLQFWMYYTNKKDALEEAVSTYCSLCEDAEYLRENIIKFSDEETRGFLEEHDSMVISRVINDRKFLKIGK